MEEQKIIPHIKIDFYEALKSGNESYIKELYVSNFFKTKNYIVKNNGNSEHARDIYQEAFTILWRNIQTGKFVPQNENSVEACLFRISKNKWLDYLRSVHYKKTTGLSEDTEDAEGAEFQAEDEQAIFKVRNKFNELGKNCRNILARFYYKKESMRTIAEEMGWTEATARNNKYRCIQKLRELMKN